MSTPNSIPLAVRSDLLQEAYRLGFLRCAGWTQRDDLFGPQGVTGPVYRKDRDQDLARFADSSVVPETHELGTAGPESRSFVNLEGLAARLLAPRSIVRDEDGYLSHPEIPCCDENVRTDVFLTAFGLEAVYVSMQGDCEDEVLMERVNDGESCLAWTPTSPEGEGWVLLEIFATEEGPFALFAREAVTPKRTRRAAPRASASAVDPGIQHMADQAGAIDRDRLRLWLTAYGIAGPLGDENMLAAIGQWVNEVLRCEPADRSTLFVPDLAGEHSIKAYQIPALIEKLKGRTITISHAPYPDIDRAIAWVYGVDLGRALALSQSLPSNRQASEKQS